MLGIEGFEVAVALAVEGDQEDHDFARPQTSLPLALLSSTAQQMLLPLGLKLLVEIIDLTKQGF